jgi:hypothetical protein
MADPIKNSHLTVVIAELADAIKHVNRFDEELQQPHHLRCARESAGVAVQVLSGILEKMEKKTDG